MIAGATMLAIVPDAYGGRGGIAQYNRDFLGAVADVGTFSSIIVLPRNAPDPYTTPKGIRQTAARRGRVSYAIAALLTAFLQPVDVVFCGHLFMSPLAALVARLKRAKLIVQTHGIEAWAHPKPPRRVAVESADLVLCVSRYTRGAVLGWAAMPPERAIVLPNTARADFTPGDGSKMRVALGLEGKRVLLTVGRMNSRQQYKGQDRVIDAIPSLVAMGHDVHYLIAGEGDDRSRLEALAAQKRVANRVHFLGLVPSGELKDLYCSVDLYVMPSTGEGFGIAFLEAMVSGTPAIGLDVAGAKDVLADGELGMCVSEADFVNEIHRALLAPKPDRDSLATAARARFGREAFQAGVRAAFNRLQETS